MALLFAAASAQAKAPPRANLTASAVADPFAGVIEPGAQVPLAATVKNAGKKPAKASQLGFFLSEDAKFDPKDIVLAAASVKKLKRAKSARVTASARLPGAARAGMRLIACADSAAKIKESRETDNCANGASALRLPEAPGTPAPGGDSLPPGQTPAPTTPALGPADDPPPSADVTAALDSAAGTRSTIGSAGGTMETTGADGSRFTLEIPADALLSEVEITMTPIAGMAGATFGQGFAGVDLRPHGLALFKPARLTIVPAQPIPLANQVGFAYSGTGTNFHYEPLDPDPAVISLLLSNFSGHGAGGATAEDRQRQDRRPISGVEAQAKQDLAEFARQARASGEDLGAYIAAHEEQLRAIFMRWDGGLVGPNPFEAESNELRLRPAVREWLEWISYLTIWFNCNCSLQGGDDLVLSPRREQIYESVRKGYRNAYDKAVDRCNNQHEVDAAPLVLSLSHEYTLLFLNNDGLGGIADADSCLRFELDAVIDLNEIATESGATIGTDRVRLSVSGLKVRADFTLSRWSGSKNPTIATWTATTRSEEGQYDDCGPYSGTKSVDAPVAVTGLDIDLNYSDENPTPRADRVVLRLDAGEGTHTYMVDGGTPESPCDWNTAGPFTRSYNGTFRRAHEDESVFAANPNSGLPIFRIANFSFVGGNVMARKHYDRTIGDPDEDHIVESTELTIYHTPGAP